MDTGKSMFKLTYFDIQGRAEPARCMFAYAGCRYEDERISYEEWPSRKSLTPFGKLPVLEDSGIEICQSTTINRYLAKKFNLFGKDEKESLLIDMVCECCYDMVKPLEKFECISSKDIEGKMKDYREKELPDLLKNLENLAKKYGSKGHFVGNRMSLADILFYNTFDYGIRTFYQVCDSSCLKNYEHLQGICEEVKSNGNIAKWLNKRPVDQYKFVRT
ncbi:DgyrCDS1359 [Dimorphilus gyrociliatus]|uniref:DgyrCDS1359 n=1 Tax=Dimorphilus gyrociliatus TaxID=2664684 RepID=A0A7I8V706_9ANNE|nr:DgyrCDS1359 [Dimorphilus gyrociliatus]